MKKSSVAFLTEGKTKTNVKIFKKSKSLVFPPSGPKKEAHEYYRRKTPEDILLEVRQILKTPEGASIIDHVKKVKKLADMAKSKRRS